MNLLIFNALSWEQRKLGDIADRVTEKNASLEVSETFTNSAEFGIISQRDFFDHDITNKENIGNYFIVRPEDFVYNPRISVTAPVGPINRNKLGRNGVMSPLYTVFRPHDVSNTYLEYFFKTNRWHAFMQFNGDSGARSDRFSIGTDLFYEMPIPAPSFNEQEKIGSFFANLSDLITLHQSKAESWKNKKNQLSTISWEQRKLAELLTRYEDPVETPHDGYIRLGIRSHAKGTFHEYVEPGHELETAQMHRVAANKLIFNITFAWEHAVAITTEDDAGKLVSHRFPQFSLSELLRPEFLKYVILDEGFHHKLYLASPGGAGRNRVLKVDEALDYPIFFPSVEEQHKIGEFLNQLNDLITLHQSELEKLRKIKESMLNMMFVQEEGVHE